MTLPEFLARLEDTTDTISWELQSRFLRGWSKGPEGVSYRCPITAVCGAPYSIIEWDKAAEALGLPPELASEIVGAADKDGQEDPRLREQLLKAVGLCEREGDIG